VESSSFLSRARLGNWACFADFPLHGRPSALSSPILHFRLMIGFCPDVLLLCCPLFPPPGPFSSSSHSPSPRPLPFAHSISHVTTLLLPRKSVTFLVGIRRWASSGLPRWGSLSTSPQLQGATSPCCLQCFSSFLRTCLPSFFLRCCVFPLLFFSVFPARFHCLVVHECLSSAE